MRKGFTLIELLVVITILAVLSGAALPYVQSYVEESRITKSRADLQEISRALAVYETREGSYSKDSVEDLTGRYLNKAPIDPWGRPYYIATASGLVISGGPSREYDMALPNDPKNADNISVPYQPPLALVSVKWLDRNQSGAVDIQNIPDQLQLNFSRKISNAAGDFNADMDTYFSVNIDGTSTVLSDVASATSAQLVAASQTVVYDLSGGVLKFVPGRDSISVEQTHDILDLASNKCLTDQAVVILPQ